MVEADMQLWIFKIMSALEAGRQSGEEQGWISSEQLKSELGI